MKNKNDNDALIVNGVVALLFLVVGLCVGGIIVKLVDAKYLSPPAEAEKPTTVEVNGITYEGEIFTDGVIYAIYDGAETLTFAGDGAICNRSNWAHLDEEERKKVKTIIIEDGITYIDNCEFSGDYVFTFPNLENVIIKSHLAIIKAAAFSDNYALKSIVFENGCDVVENNAFYGLSPEIVSGITLDEKAFHWESAKKDTDPGPFGDDPVTPVIEDWEEPSRIDPPKMDDF